jgi:hypothetical protein
MTALAFARDLIHAIPVRNLEVTNPPWWKGISRPKDEAQEYASVQINTPNYINALIVDVDQDRDPTGYSASVFAWEESGLAPNLVVENPENGHAHLYYWLEQPIRCRKPEEDRPKFDVREYANDVWTGLTSSLGGDLAYNQRWSKCPLSDRHRLHQFTTKLYRLDDFADLRAKKVRNFTIDTVTIAEGRNTALFEKLRMWAYPLVKTARTQPYASWLASVVSQAEYLNPILNDGNRKGPLTSCEVVSIAKSVANFVYRDYAPSDDWNRGVMELRLNSNLSCSERKSLGADYTNRIRRERSEELILDARRVNPMGNQSEIARITGASRMTVRKYWDRTGEGHW